MGGRTRRRTGWAVIVLSVAVHLVAVELVPRFDHSPARWPHEDAVELVVVTETRTETPSQEQERRHRDGSPEHHLERASDGARGVHPPQTGATTHAARRSPREDVAPRDMVPHDDASNGETVELETPAGRGPVCDVLRDPDSHPGCVPAPERPPLDTWRVIAPGAVAHADLARRLAAQDSPPDAGARLGEALSEDLARMANGTPHVSERPPPRLRLRSDGSYRYESAPFDAVIAPDGTVTFEDNRLTMPAPLIFEFDITDEFMRAAGQDPYQHERQWFMSQTRALRERLADERRARDRLHAMRRLERRLASIWGDSSRSAAERRRAIFELWDDCAADDVGSQARRIVVRFVREQLPEGSPHAYGVAELAMLNARRVSAEPFAPYG